MTVWSSRVNLSMKLDFKGVTVDFEGHLLTVFSGFLVVSCHKMLKKSKKPENRYFWKLSVFHRKSKLVTFSESTVSKTPENTIQTLQKPMYSNRKTRIGRIMLIRYHSNQCLMKSIPKPTKSSERSEIVCGHICNKRVLRLFKNCV